MEFDLSRLKSCGEDVRISPLAVIRYPELVSIGSHVAIDEFVVITTGMEIGDHVHIAPHVSIIGGRKGRCVVRDFAGISAGSRLVCGSDDYLGSGLTGPTVPRPYHADVAWAPVVLGKHAILGTNVVVHPGVTIGEGAAVGSCSLVTKDLPPWTVAVGVPARPVKDRPRERILDAEARLRADRAAGRTPR
jgi:galactoside O-acetyltransferase